MKIAVCVSGQLRGPWKECIPTWENMFNDDHEVDYFVHTWKNKTAPNAIAYANKDHEGKKVSDTEFNDLKRILKPKKMLIEEQIDFADRGKDQQEWGVFDPNYHSQFYGVMMACHLKQQYEQDYASQFDLCVRMRFDNYVEDEYKLSPVKLGNINVIHQTFDEFHRYRCSDVYWSAPSFDYDRICDFYSCIPKYKRDWFDLGRGEAYGPEHVLAFHIKANHIKPKQTYMPIKLKREEKHYSGGDHEIT
tara:strand:- start:121 stop:864 length:744 start_codon:yes stop_codon:yes gene_type:complete